METIGKMFTNIRDFDSSYCMIITKVKGVYKTSHYYKDKIQKILDESLQISTFAKNILTQLSRDKVRIHAMKAPTDKE